MLQRQCAVLTHVEEAKRVLRIHSALDDGTVALDRDVAVDGRQSDRPIAIRVEDGVCRQSIGAAGSQRDRVRFRIEVGVVDGCDQIVGRCAGAAEVGLKGGYGHLRGRFFLTVRHGVREGVNAANRSRIRRISDLVAADDRSAFGWIAHAEQGQSVAVYIDVVAQHIDDRLACRSRIPLVGYRHGWIVERAYLDGDRCAVRQIAVKNPVDEAVRAVEVQRGRVDVCAVRMQGDVSTTRSRNQLDGQWITVGIAVVGQHARNRYAQGRLFVGGAVVIDGDGLRRDIFGRTHVTGDPGRADLVALIGADAETAFKVSLRNPIAGQTAIDEGMGLGGAAVIRQGQHRDHR